VKTSSTPSRDSYHHGDLRNALLEKALALVAERGQEGFSLREAARELGVSPAAAYRHFADRNALLAAIAMDGHARLAAAMERALSRLPGAPGTKAHAAATLLVTGEGYVEFAVRHPSHFRVMFGPALQLKGATPGRAPSCRSSFEILVDALDGLAAAGVISHEARAGAEVAAWSSVHGLAALLVDGALPLGARERGHAIQVVTRLVLLGLGADPALLPVPGADADPRRALQKMIERNRPDRRPPGVFAPPPGAGPRLPVPPPAPGSTAKVAAGRGSRRPARRLPRAGPA